MKQLSIILFSLFATLPAAAQLYQPGEVLDYRISYRAKMFPNTEVGTVQVATTDDTYNGQKVYKVIGAGRTLPTYRWFFNLDDTYTVYIDPATLRPIRFETDVHEGDYTFTSSFMYDWANSKVHTRWQSRQDPVQTKSMELNAQSMDAISLFFNLRTASAESFREGEHATLQMVLEDTVRHLKYRYLGRDLKKVRNMGRYRTLKFECQLGTSEAFSFTDGSIFYIWISDDQNKIPLYIESPVRLGSINAYISGYSGLKFPMESLVK